MAGVLIKLAQPNKVVESKEVFGVVLPACLGNLTVVLGQSPTIVLLKAGVISLLDNNGKVTQKFFINGGVADIANNICVVSSEVVINKKDVLLEHVQEELDRLKTFEAIEQEKLQEVEEYQELEDNSSVMTSNIKHNFEKTLQQSNDAEFYQIIIDELIAFSN